MYTIARMRTLCRTLLLVAGFVPSLLAAQIVSGTVSDSAGRRPLSGVTVVVISRADTTITRAAITSTDGRFAIPLPKPGDYTVMARRIGYGPVLRRTDAVGASENRALNLELASLPVMLDTVISSGERLMLRNFLSTLTAGQQWFSDHYRRGKGVFTSGAEIELTRLGVCEYLSKIPGFHFVQYIPAGGGIRCVDGNAEIGFIAPQKPTTCIRTSIDKKWTLFSIDSMQLGIGPPRFKGDLIGSKELPLLAVKGIEIYSDPADVPRDFSYRMTGSRRCALILIWTNQFWAPDT
jgi:hypothetical protein